MSLGLQVFRTRVARRVFAMFMLAALVPVAAMAFLTLSQIDRALTNAAREQLSSASRSYGQLIFRRLRLADGVLDRLSENPPLFASLQRDFPEFDAISLIADGEVTPLFGEPSASDLAEPGPQESGRPSLLIRSGPSGVKALIARHRDGIGLVAGEIAPDYLWDANTVPYGIEICVLSAAARGPLFCSSLLAEAEIRSVLREDWPASGDLLWEQQGERFLGAYWELFTEAGFDGQPWRIVAFQPESMALASLISFNRLFPPVLAISLITVALLSIWQIRRSMVPLDKLVQGTKQIADQDFSNRLTIDSEDEFGDLAEAMNTMADRLGRQFGVLNTLTQIDQLILSSEGLDQVIEVVLAELRAIVPCDGAGMIVIDQESPELGHLYMVDYASQNTAASLSRLPTSEKERAWLLDHEQGRVLNSADMSLLSPFRTAGLTQTLIFPILKGKLLAGALVFGFHRVIEVAAESRQAASDLADRLAVALSASEREAALFNQAHFDGLTGLPNRQLCHDRLQQALAQARRDENQMAVLFLDLDNFKTINDSMGHPSGDRLLVEVANRLKGCLRDSDTIARLGGDEFVVILPRVIGATEIEAVAKTITTALGRPFQFAGNNIHITASIGLTLFPDDGTTVDELLRKADAAMYKAKAAGRARFAFFTNELDERASERMALEADLRYAFERQELSLRYQPQMDLATGEIVGAEALIRWTHPKRGPVPPELFIPILEELGLIDAVGLWVLQTATTQLGKWQADGLPMSSISVNVSAHQIRQPDFIEQVEAVLRASDMPARSLEIELTESTIVEDVEQTNGILGRLHELGVKTSIDDFGTGYSSFSYLKDLHFNALKIDRAFVCDLPDPRSAAIVSAIVAVGKTLEKTIIAEGLETEIQLAHLNKLGCNVVQGFLVSRPLDGDDFAHWLSKKLAGEDLSASFIARVYA